MNAKKILVFITIELSMSQAFGTPVWIKAQTRELQPHLSLSSTIHPAKSEVIKVGMNNSLTAIKVRLGQKIKAGDLIATSDTTYVAQEMNYLVARQIAATQVRRNVSADFQLLKKKEKMVNQLVAKNLIPRTEAENLQIAALDARKELATADTTLKTLEDQLSEARKRIKEANYYSPIDGIVSAIIVDPRQITGTLMADYDATLAKIDEPFRFVAVTQIMDTQVSKLRKGEKATVQLEGNESIFDGTITDISASADSKTRLFTVKVEFKKLGEPIPDGLTARIILKYGSAKRALALPWNAVQVSGTKAWVTTLGTGNRNSNELKKEKRLVKLGLRTDNRVEILEGIKEGEIVEAELW